MTDTHEADPTKVVLVTIEVGDIKRIIEIPYVSSLPVKTFQEELGRCLAEYPKLFDLHP